MTWWKKRKRGIFADKSRKVNTGSDCWINEYTDWIIERRPSKGFCQLLIQALGTDFLLVSTIKTHNMSHNEYVSNYFSVERVLYTDI